MNAHELKAKETQLAKARAELAAAEEDFAAAKKRRGDLASVVNRLEQHVKASKREFRVTEHALLRYVERVMRVDLGAIEDGITRMVKPQVDALGDGKFPFLGCCVAVVKDNTVLTIETKE